MEYIIDYPDLCQHCQQAIRQAYTLIVKGLTSDEYAVYNSDPEGPAMLAYDQGWTCAGQGRECHENIPQEKPKLRQQPGDPIGMFISDVGTLWAFYQMDRYDEEICSACSGQIKADETSFVNRDGSMILCSDCVEVDVVVEKKFYKVTDRYNHDISTIVCKEHLEFINGHLNLSASMHGQLRKYWVEEVDEGPCNYCEARIQATNPLKEGK
jgi:hypothetical protein